MAFWWAVGNGGGHGGGDWIVWLLRDRHRGRDRNERERRVIDNLFVILLYNLYYFINVLYCKIKVGMLEVL